MLNFKNTLLVALAAAVIGLSILAWKQDQELIALRGAALTSGERAEWQQRVWAAQQKVEALQRRLGGPRPAPVAPGSRAEGPPVAKAELGAVVSRMSSIMDRPDMVRLMALQQKAQVDSRYAGLFKRLGLPPDKLSQLKNLLADKLAAPMDVMSAAGQQGIDPVRNPQDFRQLLQDTAAQIDDRIKALLDPGSYAQYQNYLQTEPQRAVVTQLEQALSYTATPLTQAQADQLVNILASATPATGSAVSGGQTFAYVNAKGAGGAVAISDGPIPGGGPFGPSGAPISNAAVAQAQNVLSPPQVQALQEIQQQQQAAAQLREQMIRPILTGTAVGPVPATPVQRPTAAAPGG